jgi:uncharacterized protein
MQRIILLVAMFALTLSGAQAQGKYEINEGRNLPAQPKSHVGDYANVIDGQAERRLETKLALLRKRAAIEFVVVTVETTGAEDIFDYSLAAARRWKRGSGANDKGGILLMIAVKDRKWRIQLTRNLEGDLPDEVLKEHGDKMTGPFRQGNMGAGVNLFVDGVIAHLAERRAFKNTVN